MKLLLVFLFGAEALNLQRSEGLQENLLEDIEGGVERQFAEQSQDQQDDEKEN